MPKLDDVYWLIRAIGDRDYREARRHVMAMIANEKSNGRDKAVAQLEQALKSWGDNNAKLVELPHNIKPMLYPSECQKDLSQIFLADEVLTAVNDFLNERNFAEKLKAAGLSTRNKILLAGPPGNGKTTLAGAIGKELNLPVYTLKLSEIVDSLLGSTSKNINAIFEYAYLNRCLIFLDELDAIGKARSGGEGSAPREYNLIVNTILICLDRLQDNAVVIGATNMPKLLDPALVRRFEPKLWMEKPKEEAIERYITDYMDKHTVSFNRCHDLVGQPWSKVEEWCIAQHRSVILGRDGGCTTNWIGGYDGKVS